MKEVKINLVYYNLEDVLNRSKRIKRLVDDYTNNNPNTVIEKTETQIYFGAYEYILEVKLFERERTEIS